MEINPDEISKNNDSPLVRFNSTFRSEYTQKDYTRKLTKVMCEFLSNILEGNKDLVQKELRLPKKKHRGSSFDFPTSDFEARVNEFVRKAKHDNDWAESVMITIIEKLKERTKLDPKNPNHIKPVSVKNYYFPVQKLLEMNKVNIPFKLIRKSLPEQEYKDDSRGWNRKEIQKMLKHTDASGKVIILLASSSGIRVGGFDLRWKHIIPVYLYKGKYLWEDEDITESVTNEGKIVCGILKVYADSNDEYFAFITPECWDMIKEYREEWIVNTKQEPKPDDPFMKQYGDRIRPLALSGVRRRLVTILTDSGLRKPLVRGKRRHEVPPFNGFRRFFNKANKQSLSNTSTLAQLIMKENMMGHNGLIQLDRNYFKTHINELIDEYISSIPNLTISDELLQSQKIQELRQQNDTVKKQTEMELSYLQTKSQRLEQELNDMHKNMQENVRQEMQKHLDSVKQELEKLQSEREKQQQEAYETSKRRTDKIRNETHSKFEKLRQDPERMKRLKELFELLDD